MIRRTRPIAAFVALLLVASACGSTSTPEPAAQSADQPAGEAPAGTDLADDSADPAPADDELPVAPAGDDTDMVEPNDDDIESGDTGTDDTDSGNTETGDTDVVEADAEPEPEAQPAGMTWPNDGCSSDGSPTLTESADGPAPALEVRAESSDSPLPGIAVRRINCNGGWVNFQNELPADKALLVWFWAPH